MKVLFAFVLLLVAVYAQYEDSFWFRVSNHIGTDTPTGIAIKTCGLGRFYVNKKDNGRFGFGYDIAPVVNPNANGMCTGGCGSDKRSDELFAQLDERGTEEDANALFAGNAFVNFDLFWQTDADGNLINPDRILTRITNGDIAYLMSSDASVALNSADLDAFLSVTVPGTDVQVPVRKYPQATFQFSEDNRLIMQNWQLELATPTETCTVSAGSNNEVVYAFGAQGITATNLADWTFKTRVRFQFAEEAEPDGLVTVVIQYDSAGETPVFNKRVRGTAGANFGPNWIDDISIKLTAYNGDTVLTLIDDDANGPSAVLNTLTQYCSPADLDSVSITKKNVPLVKSS